MLWLLSILIIFPVVHSYILYPLLVNICAAFKKSSEPKISSIQEDLPLVSILIAARNEELVIGNKLQSIIDMNYPNDRMEVLVGSDASDDQTVEIVQKFAQKYPNVKVIDYQDRHGKSALLNKLKDEAQGDWLLCTDANVLHHKDCLGALVYKARSSRAEVVAAEVRYSSFDSAAVASDEDSFLRFENRLKSSESQCMGLVMGVEGSCYLIHRSAMPIVPSEALVDDFFITMHALLDGHKVVWEEKAAVYEEVSLSEKEEFRRKVRISRGNFQNLQWFGAASFRKFFPLGFAFLSHKVFRWLTPVFLLLALGVLGGQMVLVNGRYLELLILGAVIALAFIPGIRSLILIRSLRHWILMNIALLQGLILHTQNRGENVWEPTKRNQ